MEQPSASYNLHLRSCLVPLLAHPDVTARLLPLSAELAALATLDLEPARPVLVSCYSDREGGRPPRDPVAMLRCLLLMAMLGETRFNVWARTLKGRPELVVLSGFTSAEGPPGVGTFYDFAGRILDGPQPRACDHVVRPSSLMHGTGGRFRRNVKKEKEARKAAKDDPGTQGAVRRAVEAATAKLEGSVPTDFAERLQEILLRCAVVPSAERGMFGESPRLDVTMDGSVLPSHARMGGRRACDCRENGDLRCDCDRIFADPEATVASPGLKATLRTSLAC